jgi:hypothetical protein
LIRFSPQLKLAESPLPVFFCFTDWSVSVVLISPPGSEVGPGAPGAVATWGIAITDEVDAMALSERGKAGQASIYHLTGLDHKS